MFGYNIIFTHIPLVTVPEDKVNIHGHLHNNSHTEVTSDRHILVKSEHTYQPFKLEKLL